MPFGKGWATFPNIPLTNKQSCERGKCNSNIQMPSVPWYHDKSALHSFLSDVQKGRGMVILVQYSSERMKEKVPTGAQI